MELLMWVLDVLFYDLSAEASYAVAWWIPLAASTAVGVGQQIAGGSDRRKARSRTTDLMGQREEAGDTFQDLLELIKERAGGAGGDESVDELYGRQIQSLSDRVAGDVGSARTALERAMMAGGGDVSGSGAQLVNQLGAQGQRSIMDVISEFTERADRRNLQESRRGDQLFSQVLGRQAGMFQALAGLENESRGRADRMSTADSQLFLDTLGVGSSLSGQLLESKS